MSADQKDKSIPILLAEDDEDDRLLAQEAFSESDCANPLYFVEDGEELLDYLHHRDRYAVPDQFPRPGLILLDLNMPKKDGREALVEIKADESLRHIPIVIMTTSKAEEDVISSYALGVSSFIVKPLAFSRLVEVVQELKRYWFETVTLPPTEH